MPPVPETTDSCFHRNQKGESVCQSQKAVRTRTCFKGEAGYSKLLGKSPGSLQSGKLEASYLMLQFFSGKKKRKSLDFVIVQGELKEGTPRAAPRQLYLFACAFPNALGHTVWSLPAGPKKA